MDIQPYDIKLNFNGIEPEESRNQPFDNYNQRNDSDDVIQEQDM